jgi:hypothetical protein
MAQRANIVLADGAATPVNHTFAPNAGDGNVPGVSIVAYEDRASGIAVAFPTLTLQTRPGTKANDIRKLVTSVYYPVLETVGDAGSSGYVAPPKAAYQLGFRGEFFLPGRASFQQRKDHFAFVKNLYSHAVMTAMVVDLESPW